MRAFIRLRSLWLKVRRRFPARRRAPASVGGGEGAIPFYRTVWGEAAAAAGARVVDVDVESQLFEIRRGPFLMRLQANTTSLDDPVTAKIAADKLLVYRLLGERQVPVPKHLLIRYDDPAAAWRAARTLGGPWVVKPARDTSGGRGVTTGITTRAQLVRALARAGSFEGDVIIEEQIRGDLYRLLFLDGELLDAVVRNAPVIKGDGRSTIRDLIAAENERRRRRGAAAGGSPIEADDEVLNTLRAGGYSLRSVPPAGACVRVKTVVNENRGEDNESATARLCPAVIEESAAAVAAIGVRLAGVDLITSDPGIPLREAGGAIVDVNTGPGLQHHYYNRSGGVAVARLILERLLASDGRRHHSG